MHMPRVPWSLVVQAQDVLKHQIEKSMSDHTRPCIDTFNKKIKIQVRIHATVNVLRACMFITWSVLEGTQRVPPPCTTKTSRTQVSLVLPLVCAVFSNRSTPCTSSLLPPLSPPSVPPLPRNKVFVVSRLHRNAPHATLSCSSGSGSGSGSITCSSISQLQCRSCSSVS